MMHSTARSSATDTAIDTTMSGLPNVLHILFDIETFVGDRRTATGVRCIGGCGAGIGIDAHFAAGAVEFEAQARIAVLQVKRGFPLSGGGLFFEAAAPLPPEAETGIHQRHVGGRDTFVGRGDDGDAMLPIEAARGFVGDISRVSEFGGGERGRLLLPPAGRTAGEAARTVECGNGIAPQRRELRNGNEAFAGKRKGYGAGGKTGVAQTGEHSALSVGLRRACRHLVGGKGGNRHAAVGIEKFQGVALRGFVKREVERYAALRAPVLQELLETAVAVAVE